MKVSLPKFLGFVSAPAPGGRLSKVREAAEPYDPKTDFYRRIRPEIIDALRSKDFSRLKQVPGAQKDQRKRNTFPACIKGLEKWARRNDYRVVVTELLPQVWRSGELEVRVNPEAILEVNGARYLVKLYMSIPRLPQKARALALYLMKETFDPTTAIPAILDVRRGDLLAPQPARSIAEFAHAEAAAFVSYWNTIKRPA